MAPIVKITSQTGFVYEQNNHVAYVDKDGKHSAAFNTMMDFIKECKFSYAMLHAPTIFCEIVEQMWTSGRYDSTSKTLSVSINGTNYNIDGEIVGLLLTCLGTLLIDYLVIMKLSACLGICTIMVIYPS